MNTKALYNPFPQCAQCGSDLVMLEQKTEKMESHFSAVTTTTYRCSNQTCQDDKDKKAVVLQQQLATKKKDLEKRVQEKQALKDAKKIL